MMQRPPHLGLLEVALYADDLQAAAQFWSEIIGLEQIAHVPGRHVFFRAGSLIVLIFDPKSTSQPPSAPAPGLKPPKPKPRVMVPPHGSLGPGHLCLAVAPEDLSDWRLYLEEKGIAIEADFTWPQGGRSIYIRDPAGNSIELADPKIWD